MNDTEKKPNDRPKWETQREGVASIGARFVAWTLSKDPSTGKDWLTFENKKGRITESPEVVRKALEEAMNGAPRKD